MREDTDYRQAPTVILYVTDGLDDQQLGNGAFAWHVLEALRASGYPVVTVAPGSAIAAMTGEDTTPEDAESRFWHAQLPRMIARYEARAVLLSARHLQMLGDLRSDVAATAEESVRWLVIEDGRSCDRASADGIAEAVIGFAAERRSLFRHEKSPLVMMHALPSAAYLHRSAAQKVTKRTKLLCVQNGLPERERALDDRLETLKKDSDRRDGCAAPDFEVVCFGAGWSERFCHEDSANGFIFASHECTELEVFEPDEEERRILPTRAMLPLSAGADMHFMPDCTSRTRRRLEEDVAAPLKICLEAQSARSALGGCQAVRSADDCGVGTTMERRADCLADRRGAEGLSDDTLEGELARIIGGVRLDDHVEIGGTGHTDRVGIGATGFADHAATGSERLAAPAESRYVLVLGWFGFDNFGDELVLDIIADRVQRLHPGCIPVAVAERPSAVFGRHGLMAVALSDRVRLAWFMERSACLLICAGLFFDDGIYWTAGRRTLLDTVDYTDLPGLAGASTLAALYELPVLCYGAGAGPLNNTESKALVRFMGTLGVRFLMRDRASADYIRAAGVDEAQVECLADVAYALEYPGPARAHAWGAAHGISFSGEQVLLVALRRWEGLSFDFEEQIAHVLDDYLERDGNARVVLMSFQTDDLSLHERIAELMTHRDRACCYGLARDTEEVLSILGASNAGLAMRLHCSILMNLFGRPTVGIDYLDKVGEQYRAMGLDDLLVPLDATGGQILDALQRILDEYDRWTAVILESVEKMRALYAEEERHLAKCLDNPHVLAFPTDCYLPKG